MSACIGQPLSWLTLERHVLAELEAAAAAATGEHLAACPACTAALGTIQADRRALPALPAALPVLPESSSGARTPFVLSEAAKRPRRRTYFAWAGGGLALAAAAVVVLIVRPPDRPRDGRELTASVRVKGAGVVTLTLVREREGAIAFDPPDVRDGDRWKVQLTCAPGGGAWVDVVVYQPGEPAAVALPAQRFGCGNGVVVAGAFRVTGGAATVCARLASDGRPPAAPPATPGAGMACARLSAAP